jgi:hypothetical protein
MTSSDSLDKETYVNYCFIVRGKYGSFLDAKQYILNKDDSHLLYDRCSFSPLVCKERISQEVEYETS